jgi:hypothetical protein
MALHAQPRWTLGFMWFGAPERNTLHFLALIVLLCVLLNSSVELA